MSNYNRLNGAIQPNQPKKPKFSALIQTPQYQKSLHNALSNPKEIQKFTAAITSVVSTNPKIEECDASTILSAALCGHALGLAPSPQLGQYYIVPFKDRKTGRKVATFVPGYKGYIQLAIRSGYYKKLNVIELKEGELIQWDPITEDIEIKLITDEDKREVAETTGYYAMFRYVNGFEKAIYWSKTKMKNHAIKYSKGYASDLKNGTTFTFWTTDFDDMAKKTLLRQLIGKWGIMSVDMQKAYVADSQVLNDDGTPDYSGEYVESDVSDSPSANVMIDVPIPNEELQMNRSDQPVTFSLDDLAE